MKAINKVFQYSLNGELLHVFEGVGEAARSINASTSSIVSSCTGKITSSCGYIWMYTNDESKLRDRVSKIPKHKKEPQNLDGEEWRNIDGYNGLYQVSNFGRVRTLKRKGSCGGIMKHQIWGAGYPCIRIGGGKNPQLVNIHRLVAETFISNPDNLPCVNHKDEDKTNNHVNNLEWCSYKHNNNYGSMKGFHINHPSVSKPVMHLNKDGEIIATYRSIKEASRVTGISYQVLISYLTGRYHTGGGYDWKYLTE